ncbi:olfactory receptor 6C2-like [Hippopotamus amphibius kiboko]|uniref:olfactory receptor 6C2-like n=1 Tax=Hippopotamus amphibius kiboko TaxID=575201 RepID=UPI00259996B0|nr:olfactory receptor 6C2-like [Hippopotamus amphibius kiboko]
MRNHTAITMFMLLGLTNDPQLEILAFIFLLITYLLSVVGNLTIISLILVDSHLQTAVYFFLQNFSFLEISFTTACVPTYLYIISSGDKTITIKACYSQIFFAVLFGATEFFLLAVMSYDRYVAICRPLHYMSIMNSRVCRNLILCCWVSGLSIVLPPFTLSLHLEFCDSVIDDFVCDAPVVLKNSCSDTRFIEQLVVFCAILTIIMTLVCVALSYIYISRMILRLPSAQQRKKAFSTCSSHMIVVSISYGSCIFMYVKPTSKDEVALNKRVSLLTTSVAPLLNPFIYTLRNKQVKQSFHNTLKRLVFLSKKY